MQTNGVPLSKSIFAHAIELIDRHYTDSYLPPDVRRVEVAHEIELDATQELPAVQS